jgi:hypothetical protein
MAKIGAMPKIREHYIPPFFGYAFTQESARVRTWLNRMIQQRDAVGLEQSRALCRIQQAHTDQAWMCHYGQAHTRQACSINGPRSGLYSK